MILGPLRPLRSFMVGFGGPNHACFYKFYLKDLTWSDNDNNISLGSVVAAQQPFPLVIPGMKARGSTSGVTKSSGV